MLYINLPKTLLKVKRVKKSFAGVSKKANPSGTPITRRIPELEHWDTQFKS